MQVRGEEPVVPARFDIAPIEVWPSDAARYEPSDVNDWNPCDEPDFLQIPIYYREIFNDVGAKVGPASSVARVQARPCQSRFIRDSGGNPSDCF